MTLIHLHAKVFVALIGGRACRTPEMDDAFERVEVQLAKRNHGVPLEGLRYDVTPLGMHFVLSHFDIPAIDPDAWRLSIGGLVDHPFVLTLADLRGLPVVERTLTIECAGNGRIQATPRPVSQPWLDEAVSTATWTGTPLTPLLERAGIAPGAVDLVFRGPDRGFELGREVAYERSLAVRTARAADALVVYAMNGQPLPPQHGFPVRLVVPGWYGMASVKWLTEIEAIGAPFRGHYQATAYRIRTEPGEEGVPVERIPPRALLVPPGIPSWPDRARTVDRGTVALSGRAWSGLGAITRVDLSTDGSTSWSQATLDPQPDRHAWCRFSFSWRVDDPGEYALVCRATDTSGATQPLAPRVNLGGYGNNAVQVVPVTVR